MKTVVLGEIATFANGGTPSRSKLEFWDGPIPWITGADITEEGSVAARSFISEEAVARSATQVLPKGTVLLLTRTSVGKVGVLPKPMAINQDITGITPSADLDTGYLVRFLRSSKPKLLQNLRGATIKGITRDDVASLKLKLPPLSEQRRIAAILDHADALRTKRRQVLAHLGNLAQAIFIDMFGNEAWNTTLGNLATVQIGPFGSLLHQEDYVAGGVPVINPMHIRGSQLLPDPEFSVSLQKAASLNLYRLQEGDIVLGRRGEMGRAGIASSQHVGMLCGTGSLILRPRDVDSRFLHAVATSPRMKGHLTRSSLGTTLPNLNSAIVKMSPAPMVASQTQEVFAARLRAVEEAYVAIRQATDTDEELFASLQSDAYSDRH